MASALLVIQFILAILVSIVVLLQKSSSIGLGAYSGSNDTMFGAKGPNSFLAKITFTLGFLFVVNTIALGYFYNQDRSSSVIDSMAIDDLSAPQIPATAEPINNPATDSAIPEAPVAPAPSDESKPNQ